jgi:hypothetical protein
VVLAYDYFGNPDRDVRVMLAVSVLAWLPTVLVPRLLARPIGWVASASMWIFMTHWTVWPLLTPWMPRPAAMCGTVVAGVALWAAWRAVSAHAPAIETALRFPARSPRTIRHAEQFRMVEHV